MKPLRSNEFRQFWLTAILFVLWNIALTTLQLWQSLWLLGLLVNFLLIVVMAEGIGYKVPVRYKKIYERGLAFGFPILLLLSWELIVRAGILSPRWFPPPTRIIRVLWHLAITYDTFTKTSLLGRPWLIPQKFA